jgi:hypothetical protein
MNTPALSSPSRSAPRFASFPPLAVPAPAATRPSLPVPARPAALPAARRLELRSPPAARGSAREVLAAVLLVVAWTMLWGFFVAGVAEPGARLAASAAAHPSVAPAPAP